MRILVIAALGLFLGGCVASGIDRLNKLEAILATEVDAITDQIEDRRCKLPIDVLERLVDARGIEWFKGWAMSCPAAQRLFDSLKQPVQLTPPTVTIE